MFKFQFIVLMTIIEALNDFNITFQAEKSWLNLLYLKSNKLLSKYMNLLYPMSNEEIEDITKLTLAIKNDKNFVDDEEYKSNLWMT